ncbi:hypothetical protein HMPREF9406_1682 [Clostridium sp. HGF2]|nr:hypothetical protein HMPREF9406_1682 [Clostridium sp. HGF2]
MLGKKLNPQLFIDFLLYENKQSLYKIYSFSGSCLWMYTSHWYIGHV